MCMQRYFAQMKYHTKIKLRNFGKKKTADIESVMR